MGFCNMKVIGDFNKPFWEWWRTKWTGLGLGEKDRRRMRDGEC